MRIPLHKSWIALFGSTILLSLAPRAQAITVIDNTEGLTAPIDQNARTIGSTSDATYWGATAFKTGSNQAGYSVLSFSAYLQATSGQYVDGRYTGNDLSLKLGLYKLNQGLPKLLLGEESISSPSSAGYQMYTDLGVLRNIVLEPSTSYAIAIQAYNPSNTVAVTGWGRSGFQDTYSLTEGFSYVGSFQSSNAGDVWYSIPDSLLYQLEVTDPTPVPAPLPILMLPALYHYSRSLRKRIKMASQQTK